jgi:excinuclease ABC subunit C
VHLRPDAPALHLIQEIRDEATVLRSPATVPGGPRPATPRAWRTSPESGRRRKKLLAAFGGIDGVRNATIEDLCRVEGINRHLAEQIYNALR